MARTAGHPKYTLGGTDTVEVSVAVAKGQGVERDPSNPGKVRPWGAASTTRLGVAQISGSPLSANLDGNMAPARRFVTVQRAPQVVNMVFTASAANGDLVIAAAAGAVTKAGATPDAATVVGRCVEPAGVVANQIGAVELT